MTHQTNSAFLDCRRARCWTRGWESESRYHALGSFLRKLFVVSTAVWFTSNIHVFAGNEDADWKQEDLSPWSLGSQSDEPLQGAVYSTGDRKARNWLFSTPSNSSMVLTWAVSFSSGLWGSTRYRLEKTRESEACSTRNPGNMVCTRIALLHEIASWSFLYEEPCSKNEQLSPKAWTQPPRMVAPEHLSSKLRLRPEIGENVRNSVKQEVQVYTCSV